MKVLSALLMTLIVSSSLAAQSACSAATTVVIREARNRFIMDATAADLTVTVEKRAVKIDSVVRLDSARVLLLVDESVSMTDSRMGRGLPFVLAAEALRYLPQSSPVAVLTFADKIQRRTEFSTDRKPLLDLVQQTMPAGHTALLDALTVGIQSFGSHQPGDTILVLSDASDNRSHTSMETVRKAAVAAGVRVSFFVAAQPKIMEEGGRGQAISSEIARSSGGTNGFSSLPIYLDQKELKALDVEIQVFVAQFSGLYEVKISAPSVSGEAKIHVAADRVIAGKRKRLEVAYPPNALFLCQEPQPIAR